MLGFSDEYATLCLGGSKKNETTIVVTKVDECALRAGICGGGRCIDTPDAFDCDCYPGYHKQKSGDAQVCEG